MAWFRCGSGLTEAQKNEIFKEKLREFFGDSFVMGYSSTSTGGSPGNGAISWSINTTPFADNSKIHELLEFAGYTVTTNEFDYSWSNTSHKDTREITTLSAEV